MIKITCKLILIVSLVSCSKNKYNQNIKVGYSIVTEQNMAGASQSQWDSISYDAAKYLTLPQNARDMIKEKSSTDAQKRLEVIESYSKSIGELNKNLNLKSDELDTNNYLTSSAKLIIKSGAIEAVATATGGPAGLVLGKTVSNILDTTITAAENDLKSNIQGYVEKAMDGHYQTNQQMYDNISKIENEQERNSAYKKLKEESVKLATNGTNFDESIKRKIEEKTKEQFDDFVKNKSLQTNKNTEDIKKDTASLKAKLDETGNNIINTQKFIIQAHAKEYAMLQDIRTRQEEINKSLTSTTNEIKVTTESIKQDTTAIRASVDSMNSKMNYVVDFVYGQMTDKQKISYWDDKINNAKPGTEEYKNLVLKKQKAELYSSINNAFQIGSALIELGQKLKINPKVINAMSEVQDKANKIYSISNIISGGNLTPLNYLQMTNLAIGLFSKNQMTDIAGERHKQVMEELHNIRQDISEVKNLVIDVLNAQVKIMEQLNTITQSIVTLNEKVNLLDTRLQIVTEMSDMLLNKDALSCETFLNSRYKYKGYSKVLNDFFDLRSLSGYMSIYGNLFLNCNQQLNDIFGSNESGQNKLKFTFKTRENKDNTDIIKKEYSAVFNYFNYGLSRDEQFAVLNTLANSNISFIYQLNTSSDKVEDDVLSDVQTYISSNENLLDPYSLGKHIQFLNELLPLTEIYNPRDGIIKRDEIDLFANYENTLSMKQKAINLASKTLIQFKAFSGEALIPYIYEKLKNDDTISTPDQALEKNNYELYILLSNHVIRNNFIRYAIFKKLAEKTLAKYNSEKAYLHYGAKIENVSLMKDLLVDFKLNYFTKKITVAGKTQDIWFLKVGNNEFQFPTVQQINKFKIERDFGFYILKDNQQKTIESMVTDMAFHKLDYENKNNIVQFLEQRTE